jgi:hypothetical protein
VHGDNFETVLSDDEKYSIMGGWYLSLWSRSILEDDAIDGLILDTMWHVLCQYVTALVMAIYCNVGVPLGFSFGVTETVKLDQQQYAAFAEFFAINLRQYVVESDQGSALRTLCARNGQTQLIRLRHFLVYLKLKEFSVPVGNLVKCWTASEFETLKALYEMEFRSVTDQKRHGLLLWTLKKAGLTYADGIILIVDEQRLNAVSMWKRVSMRMPSTTNSIEAMHEHLNEAISRKNLFWASQGILYNTIADKTLHFDLTLAHDFRGALKRCRRRSQFLSRELIQQECAHLGTTPDHCSCGETVHLSASYRTDVPCSHQYAMRPRSRRFLQDWACMFNRARKPWSIPTAYMIAILRRVGPSRQWSG